MLNIQVRGFLAKIKIRSISKKQKEFLHTNISNSKTTLTETVESQFKTDFLSVNEIVLPIVTDDAELIVTSFPENDYYSDGYSFFREKLKTLTDKASILEDIKVNNYGLMKKTVYYGCSFEADLKQVDYQNFDKNHLDIETVNIPFLRQNYIKNIPMNRLGLESDLDGVLLLLSSEASSFMTGSIIPVDGGHLINPL